MKNLVLYFCFFACINTQVFLSQNFLSDIEKMNATLSDGMECKLTYKLFRSGVQEPVETITGSYKSSKEGSVFVLGSVSAYSNVKEQLLINKEAQYMALAKPSAFGEMGQVDFTKLHPFIDTVKVVASLTENIVGYAIFLKPFLSNPYKRIEVYLDKRTFFPVKIRLHFNNELDFSSDNSGNMAFPIVEVRYNDVKKRKFGATDFETRKYYQLNSDGTLSGKGEYSEFEFFNQKDL